MLLRELILTEKVYQPYWTQAYAELSEKLLSPIQIDYADSDLISSNLLSKKKEGQLQSLTMNNIKVQNKSCQKTCYQLYTSTVVDRWEKEATKTSNVKSLKIQLKMNCQQRKIIDEWMNTSNYVYNKTIDYINCGHNVNFYDLRDKLVTNNTKKKSVEYNSFNVQIEKKKLDRKNKIIQINNNLKDIALLNIDLLKINEELANIKQLRRDSVKNINSIKNTNINNWELKTPKEIRAGAINDVCKAYKTGFSNLKLGNIKYFKLKFRKKNDPNRCAVISNKMVKIINNKLPPSGVKMENSLNSPLLQIAPHILGKNNCLFKLSKKTISKNLKIETDIRIIKQKNKYYVILTLPVLIEKKKKPINYCGIDPGVRTFMTSFSNTDCIEYKHNSLLLKRLNEKINKLKNYSSIEGYKRIRKRAINKREKKKINIIDELHWKTINHLTNKNDIIFYGDIKSHNIVKNSRNKTLNRNFNDLRFFIFKQRLEYKMSIKNKLLFIVHEANTTKTCSFCGSINCPNKSEVYNCSNCKRNIGRDINAAKNILMKGIITYL